MPALRLLSNQALHLILMPTERCNLRCVYCYEDFARGRMMPAVVQAVKALIGLRAPLLSVLSIEWFGGEPLLAYSTLVDLQGHACTLMERHRGLHVVGSLTTNGTLLTQDRFRELLRLRVERYQVSIDGPAEVHDRARPRVSGRTTFQDVWRNLRAMQTVDARFDVRLRVHVTQDNLQRLPAFIDDLASAFRGDARFRLALRRASHDTGRGHAPFQPLREEDADALEQIKRRATDAGLAVYRGAYTEPGALQACYAAAANSLVVRSDGELAKCTVALSHPRNRVGHLRPDGSVRLVAPNMLGWIRGAFSGDRSELDCPMKGWADSTASRAPVLPQLEVN